MKNKLPVWTFVVFGLLVGWLGGTVWPLQRKAPVPAFNEQAAQINNQLNAMDRSLQLKLTELDSKIEVSNTKLSQVEGNLVELKSKNDEKVDYLRNIPADESFRIFSIWLSSADSVGE